MTFFFFLLYILLWFLVGTHLERRFKLQPVPLAISLAGFLGMLFALASLGTSSDPFPLPTTPGKVAAFLFLSLLTAITMYFAIPVVAQKPYSRRVSRGLSLVIPFLLAELLMFVWVHTYHIEASISLLSLSVTGLFALVGFFTALLCYRTNQQTRIDQVLAVFMIVLLLAPVAYWAVPAVYAAAKPAKQDSHTIKHVILITVDTLRADVLSAYGAAGVATPNIDQLAKDGVLFQNAISAAPWTLPAVASIMTGLPPTVHGAVRGDSDFAKSLKTLAEYMGEANYHTAAIVSNPNLSARPSFSQGFLEYNFFPKWIGGSFGARLLYWLTPALFSPSTDGLTNLAIGWLESNRKMDFFLWIHYFDPHDPYAPPDRFSPEATPPPGMGTNLDYKKIGWAQSTAEKDWIRSVYQAEVKYVDENIGRFLAALRRLNLYEDSLIVLTSDHGEEFWEHGAHGHGRTLYNELLRVPLVIKLPFSTSTGEVSTIVPTQSMLPTFLDLCGIGFEEVDLPVSSLAHLLQAYGQALEPNPIVSTGTVWRGDPWAERHDDAIAIIVDGLKYIHFPRAERDELYDLAQDPEEQNSIFASSPDHAQRARSTLREYSNQARLLRKLHGIGQETQASLDEHALQQLRSLGYIQ